MAALLFRVVCPDLERLKLSGSSPSSKLPAGSGVAEERLSEDKEMMLNSHCIIPLQLTTTFQTKEVKDELQPLDVITSYIMITRNIMI